MSNNFALTSNKTLVPVLGRQQASQGNYNYYPLLSGDKFPSFVLNGSSFISVKDKELFDQPFTSLHELLEQPQPLVIAFLNVTEKIADVDTWKSFQADVEIMGGRLLIVTNSDNRSFTHKTRKENELNIWEDKHQQLAEDAGLYDSQNPISDWLSGIDTDIPLPAFYVLGKEGNILFHHIDYALKTVNGHNFSESPFFRNLLTSVYQAASEKRNNARKAVS